MKAPKGHAKPHNQALIDKTATSKWPSKARPSGMQKAKKAKTSSPATPVAMEREKQQDDEDEDLCVWSLLACPSSSSMEAEL